jgi:hypothetical protein
MKQLLLIFLLCLAPPLFRARGQTLESSDIIPAGGVAVHGSVLLSWTVGQTATHTRSHRGGDITEGLQQPFLSVIAMEERPLPFTLSLYPNPTRTSVIVTLQGVTDDVQIILYSLLGAPLLRRDVQRGDSMLRIPLVSQPAGMYLLTVVSRTGERLALYKILKAE